MQKRTLAGALLALVFGAGCSDNPTRPELVKMEGRCLQTYCCSNAVAAKESLLRCERYAHICQQHKVPGVLYDQVYWRTYGRLYLVNSHLGRRDVAAHYLSRFLEVDSRSMHAVTFAELEDRNLHERIEKEVDRGLEVAWKHH